MLKPASARRVIGRIMAASVQVVSFGTDLLGQPLVQPTGLVVTENRAKWSGRQDQPAGSRRLSTSTAFSRK